MSKAKKEKAKPLAEEIEIRVMVKGRVLLATFDQATREGRSSLEVIRERIEGPVLLQEKAKLEDFSNTFAGVRPKRKKGAWWLMAEKFVIAVPLTLKCDLMRIARENIITQNELGLLIVRAAMKDATWLASVLAVAVRERAQADENSSGR